MHCHLRNTVESRPYLNYQPYHSLTIYVHTCAHICTYHSANLFIQSVEPCFCSTPCHYFLTNLPYFYLFTYFLQNWTDITIANAILNWTRQCCEYVYFFTTFCTVTIENKVTLTFMSLVKTRLQRQVPTHLTCIVHSFTLVFTCILCFHTQFWSHYEVWRCRWTDTLLLFMGLQLSNVNNN